MIPENWAEKPPSQLTTEEGKNSETIYPFHAPPQTKILQIPTRTSTRNERLLARYGDPLVFIVLHYT